jgi:hypothetical protein
MPAALDHSWDRGYCPSMNTTAPTAGRSYRGYFHYRVPRRGS